MASGFSSGGGGAPNIFNSGGISGRSMMGGLNNGSYRSPLAGILPEQTSQILQQGRPDLIGKRSLFEFQQQQQQQQLQQQNQLLAQLHQQQQQQQQQQQNLNLYLRNVKPRIYQHASPISPLSSTDLSASLSPEVSSISSTSSASNARYGLPIFQQLRAQQIFSTGNANGINSSSSSLNHPYFSTVSHPNLLPNRGSSTELVVRQDPEKKLMNRLQELEKQLLDDNEFEEGDAVSAVTNSEWSETIQNLIIPAQKPAISPSPTSSSSSCSSAQAVCPKQVIMEVACAISEGKKEAAVEVLTRLNSSSITNVKGTTEQRLTAYVTSALRRRVNLTDYPSHSPISQLYSKEHAVSTQMLYEASPCFKLGFMAANLALMQTISDQIHSNKLQLHVVDFDIGQGGQYVQLLDALAATKSEKPIMLKISTSAEFITGGGGVERLNAVGESLKMLANKVGVEFEFNVLNMGVRDLSLESLGVEENDVLAVNFAFLLYRLPDESVTTENLRDELLRRVKGWSPKVVTVVEQEMNANTAAFGARVNEACGYYGALFDSLDSTGPREGSDRAKIEDGLGRRMSNSVACEGRDRVERCEVFGKWRARLSMAGFEPKPLSPTVADSLVEKLNSWTRGNPGFILKEQSGGICFGWSGRTLTVASAWH